MNRFGSNLTRTSGEGPAEYSQLYYRCNRILADLFNSDEVIRSLTLQKRYVMEGVSRHVVPRAFPTYHDRSRLHMMPVFLYNSARESEIIHELKEKVRFFSFSSC